MKYARTVTLGLSLAFGWAVAVTPFDTGNATEHERPPEKTTSGPADHETDSQQPAKKTTLRPAAHPPVYKTYSVRPPNTKLSAAKAQPRFCPGGKRYVWVCVMICDARGCRPSSCHPEVQCW
jgi:hypothetical protein